MLLSDVLLKLNIQWYKFRIYFIWILFKAWFWQLQTHLRLKLEKSGIFSIAFSNFRRFKESFKYIYSLYDLEASNVQIQFLSLVVSIFWRVWNFKKNHKSFNTMNIAILSSRWEPSKDFLNFWNWIAFLMPYFYMCQKLLMKLI